MVKYSCKHKSLRWRWWRSTLMLVTTSTLVCTPIYARELNPIAINLPAQSLDRDIRDLARQAGITISFSRRALKKYNRKTFSGNYTPAESLEILLRDTDYTYQFVNKNTVRIFKKKSTKPVREIKPKPSAKNAEPPQAADPSGMRPSEIQFSNDEIFVTANKRTQFEILQSAPYSASVISGNMLKTLGVIDTQSLSLHIAGVEMTNLGSSRNKISIRGISDGAFNGRVQATVGVYFNDTPINFNAPYPEIPLIDIESIEVLRGPQGSLYGAGSIGGIYHISTKSPALKKPSAWLETDLSMTKEGGVNTAFKGMANLPLVKDEIGLRAVGYVIDNSGYIDDIRLGLKDVNSTTIRGGRLNGLWQISPDWKLSLGAAYHDVDTKDTQYELGSLPRLQRANYLREPHHDDLIHLHFNIAGTKQWGKINSTTSWINRSISDQFDASLSLPTILNRPIELTRYQENRDIDFFSHETNINIDVSDRIDILLGGFIKHANIDFLSDYNILGDELTNPETLYKEIRSDTSTHYGGFGEIDLVLTDKIEISAGLRWFDEHLNTKTLIDDFVVPEASITGAKTDNDFLPRFNIGYQFTDDAYLYGLATVGYRVGGLNTGNAVNSGALPIPNSPFGNDDDDDDDDDENLSIFESDVITMYEFGGKTNWLNDKLIVNASLFFVDWNSIQTEHILVDGFSSVLNAGDATNLGYDFEVLFRPTSNFDFQANLTVNDPDLSNINPALGPNIDGKHLPRIPDYSGGFVATYRKPITKNWDSTWSIDYAYTGSSQLSFAPADDLSMGKNHFLNARVNFVSETWQIEGYVNNVLDDKSNTFSFGNPFTFRLQKHLTPQRPRTIGMRVRRQF